MLNSRNRKPAEPSVTAKRAPSDLWRTDSICEALLAGEAEASSLAGLWGKLESHMVKHHNWCGISEQEQRALPGAKEMHEIEARLTILSREREKILPLLPAMAATDRSTMILKLKVVLMLLLPDEHPEARTLLDSALRDLAVVWR